jgi:hypothetical protein
MAGQGFDPDFIYSWPTGRMGVMEGDSAVQAVFGSQLEKLKKNGESPDAELTAEMDKVRETYDMELDAKYAAARGFVDAVITPETTRALELALRTATLAHTWTLLRLTRTRRLQNFILRFLRHTSDQFDTRCHFSRRTLSAPASSCSRYASTSVWLLRYQPIIALVCASETVGKPS